MTTDGWWDETFDVLVVGGGGAGLMAAVEAAEAGAQVLLIDKQPDVGGGATGMSVGSITAAGTALQREAGVEDDIDGHHATVEEMMARAEAARPGETYDRDLTRLMVENAPRVVERLSELGVAFSGPHPEHPHPIYRMHNAVPSSMAYIEVLRQAALDRGVQIRPNTTVDELQRDESGAVSVAALRHVRTNDTRAARLRRGAVLAAGDFSANDELARRHGRPPEISAVEPLQPNATGDGILVAQRLGAAAVNLHRGGGAGFRTALAPYVAPERSLYAEGAVLVNREGRRFCNELGQPALAANEQPGRLCYLLFDARLAARIATAEEDVPPARDGWFRSDKLFLSTFPGVAYAYIEDYRRSTDYFFEGETLAAVAEVAGLPAEGLEATVESLNRAANGEEADPFGREPVAPIGEPSFYLVGPVRPVNIFSAGGLRVDREMHVLDEAGAPIPGLYACGANAEAGVFLGGHGHHLAWAFGTGMIAGRNAAGEGGSR